MNRGVYRAQVVSPRRKRRKRAIIIVIVLMLGAAVAYKLLAPSPVEQAVDKLQFDSSVTEAEKQTVKDAIASQSKSYGGELTMSVKTGLDASQAAAVLAAYVPITNVYATRQAITKTELSKTTVYILPGMNETARSSLAAALGIGTDKLKELTTPIEKISDTSVAFIPAEQLSSGVKLLTFETAYYLDTFTSGAVFRQAVFSGSDAANLNDLQLNRLNNKDSTLKVNMTGVTALTRVMQKKLTTVKDPTYFSEKIGGFLADADITHVSNEVSFREGCPYSNVSFCSPPEFIETLKDSGVDLVELTGNHNNDNGNTYNTESINLYHSLGWHTYGGGLNKQEAAKPYVADQKNNKITFLAYNLADGEGSGAISGSTTAGANIYTDQKAKADIEAAKRDSQFVIVDIQYSECQAYPAGYVEFPECDVPIGGQEETFRQLSDWGADMVIGSSAHQPQTYEMYKGKPIYYGIGNLYFEQTQWPGTERGIILTHYFANGKLLQTKLSPTVYDKDLQTHMMDTTESDYFLGRLKTARITADL